jgi:hypothetical protein
MERIVINKKEYAELMNAKRRLATLDRKKMMRFIEAAFGALKGDYGKGSSVEYVTKLRKLNSI